MLFGSMKIKNNELHIGGMSVTSLLEKHGSPLYVYDKVHIENMIDIYQENFRSDLFKTSVAYASKAFLTKEMVRLVESKNMSIDLVSMGEMYTAKSAGYNMSNALIHGNNKSLSELHMCFDYEVGYIVIDNVYELEKVMKEATNRKQPIKTLFRVNPGVEAHTHEYIVTAKLTSKFGESIFDDNTISTIINMYNDCEYVSLEGFHCHIGSQIFNGESFIKAIEVMSNFINRVENTYKITINTLNLGGGFGVYYTNGDVAVDVKEITRKIIKTIEEKIITNELSIKELIIEPGRSIVSNAGVTLYKIGYKKETYGGKNYLFIDGGMTDNIRPALYQAKYECDIATNMNAIKTGNWTIAGKLCESGDIIIEDTPLQDFDQGEVLVVYTTGAYNYSMASNYNRILKPEVVFVKNGTSQVVVKRETLEDLIRNDV